MRHTLMTCSCSRKDLAVEVREGVRKRVTALMRARRSRGIDVHVVLDEELLEHLASGDEEVAIAALTPELERAFGRHFRDGAVRDGRLDIRRDDDLQIALDTLGEADEVRGGAYPGEVRVRWNCHVGFERNVILELG